MYAPGLGLAGGCAKLTAIGVGWVMIVGAVIGILRVVINKRRAQQLFGETIREAGLLLIVFSPLDALFQPDRPAVGLLAMLFVGALILIIAGIIIESGEERPS